VLAYVVGIALTIGDYLKFTIGLTLGSYWAYDTVNFPVVLGNYIHVAQPALYGALIALVTRTWSRQHTVMLLAGLGYSVSYFVQSKGFVYHAYPVLVCSVAFLGICLGMQWLYEGSEEAPDLPGLGVLSGSCRRLRRASSIRPPVPPAGSGLRCRRRRGRRSACRSMRHTAPALLSILSASRRWQSARFIAGRRRLFG
jgi:hypothetical protein